MSPSIPFLILWMIAASLLGAAMMAWDKRAAERSSHRISERALLTVAALGGWPGMMITGRSIRHKTSKRSFRILFAACAITNLIAMVW